LYLGLLRLVVMYILNPSPYLRAHGVSHYT
jgi:hypothetical protein